MELELKNVESVCKHSPFFNKKGKMFMSWILFLQIEVILMTLGLVVSFILSMYQNGKDNSFAKKATAFGGIFNQMADSITKNITNVKKED